MTPTFITINVQSAIERLERELATIRADTGADSAEAATLRRLERLLAAGNALAEVVDQRQDVAGPFADRLLAAWDAAKR